MDGTTKRKIKHKPKVKFTEKRLQSLPCPTKGYDLYRDAENSNLAVRVTAGDARSYVYESRVNGENVRVTIGKVGKWKLADAKAEARRLATVIDRGIDPRDEAAAERARAEAARTETQRHAHIVAGVWDAYIKANKANWGERHLDDHLSLAHPGKAKKKRGKGLTKPGPLAALMGLKLSELTSEYVASWLEREAKKRPTSAAGSYRLLRAFVKWTADEKEYQGIIPVDACTAKRVRAVLPPSNAKKNDCLQKGQLAAWFAGVRRTRNSVVAAFLQCLLLTGARREELGRLRWGDVDFTWNQMTLRDKVEGTRIIPLTPYVASLLNALPRRNEWVFHSVTAKAGRLVEPTKAHIAALKAAGMPHVTLHGLRRSFRTLSGWLAMPVGLVAQIMGHKPSAIAEKHYEDRPVDMLAEHHVKLEAWILEQAGIAFAPTPAGRLGVVTADGAVRAAL
jgi:integrase